MMYLLQGSLNYYKEASPEQVRIVGIVIGAFILFILIRQLIKGKTNPIGSSPRRFSSFNFRRLTSSYGLDKEQIRTLENIFRSNSVADPERVIRDPVLMDKYFANTYRSIRRDSKSEEETQLRLKKFFALRNTIEAVPVNVGSITSTRKIPEKTPAVLSIDKLSYNVHVLDTRGETLIMEAPKNALGSQIKMNKGTRVVLSFINKSSKGLFFESRVLKNVTTLNGPGLELAHSERLIPMAQRFYRRKQINEYCSFYLVFLDNTGPNRKKPKLILDKKRFTGTVLDISAGGCAIKTMAPINIDLRLKIEMNLNDPVTVLGQVLRTNRSRAAGIIMHIKFLKVPRRSSNTINASVFEYDD